MLKKSAFVGFCSILGSWMIPASAHARQVLPLSFRCSGVDELARYFETSPKMIEVSGAKGSSRVEIRVGNRYWNLPISKIENRIPGENFFDLGWSAKSANPPRWWKLSLIPSEGDQKLTGHFSFLNEENGHPTGWSSRLNCDSAE